MLYFQKRPLEAEKAYKQAVQFNPSLKDALYNLGTVLLELEKWSEAEGIFERVLELDQQNIEALHNLGVVKLEQGRFREAEEPLTQVATQLATTNTLYCPAWFNLGEVLFNLNRIEEAQRAYEKANLHSPFDWQYKKEVKNILYQLHAYTGPDASYNIKELILQALELSNRGKSKLAIEIFKTSNKMTPKNPIILLYWANELDLVGEKSEAEKKLNEAIQMDVDLVKEYISFRQEGSFQETTIWESSLTFWMAFKGKCKSCETVAQFAVNRFNKSICFNCGAEERSPIGGPPTGRSPIFGAAIPLHGFLYEKYPEVMNLGNLLVQMDEFTTAEHVFDIAVKLWPSDPDCWKSLAHVLDRLKKTKKSLKACEKALSEAPLNWSGQDEMKSLFLRLEREI